MECPQIYEYLYRDDVRESTQKLIDKLYRDQPFTLRDHLLLEEGFARVGNVELHESGSLDKRINALLEEYGALQFSRKKEEQCLYGERAFDGLYQLNFRLLQPRYSGNNPKAGELRGVGFVLYVRFQMPK